MYIFFSSAAAYAYKTRIERLLVLLLLILFVLPKLAQAALPCAPIHIHKRLFYHIQVQFKIYIVFYLEG
jgi:hypothetical protein